PASSAITSRPRRGAGAWRRRAPAVTRGCANRSSARRSIGWETTCAPCARRGATPRSRCRLLHCFQQLPRLLLVRVDDQRLLQVTDPLHLLPVLQVGERQRVVERRVLPPLRARGLEGGDRLLGMLQSPLRGAEVHPGL